MCCWVCWIEGDGFGNDGEMKDDEHDEKDKAFELKASERKKKEID